MRFLGRSLTGLLLLILTLALLGLAAIMLGNALRQSLAPGGPSGPTEERVVAATVLTLAATEISPRITAYGKIEAQRTLAIRARQGGTVVWVSEDFRDGAEVVEGAPLLRTDPVQAEEALALARADLDEAEGAASEAVAAVALAVEDQAAAETQAALRRQSLDRQRDLQSQGAGSPQAVETAELAVSSADQSVLSRRQALATARARVDQTAVAVTRAGIALAEATRDLAETELRAGISGRIEGVSVVPGAVLNANEDLGRIIDPASLEVALRLSTAQFTRLADRAGVLQDSVLAVILPGAGEAVSPRGRLDRVGAAVGDGQTGRLVYATLDMGGTARTLLKPGDFVEVAIEAPPLAGVAQIPATAVGPQETVLLLGPDDRLEEAAVEILGRQGDAVIVAVGDLAGREIVAERSAFLGAGIRVRPIRPVGASGSAQPADG